MSKEPIPIGLLCTECDKYATCTSLCAYAEQYVSQDAVSQRQETFSYFRIKESTITDDFTSYITSHKFKGRGRPKKK